MNASSVLTYLLRPRPTDAQAAAELLDSDQMIRLAPRVAADDLPPEFEGVLQVQVLGYRERLAIMRGRRMHVLDPVWTLVPKDR
ncbi:MAG TPA: hypothetical protein VK681_02135 [Reyranella sp.]|jgi:hypothetical protein|nr:hypothetical protein [Reyranella sp.]